MSLIRKVGLGLLVILGLILLEARQQYYYVDRFDLHPEDQIITYLDIVFAQALWWVLWLTGSIPFFIWLMRVPTFRKNKKDAMTIAAWIIGTFVFVIFFFGAVQILNPASSLTYGEVWDYTLFKFFQKAPIGLISFGVLVATAYSLRKEEEVAIVIEQMNVIEDELKHLKLQDKPLVLSVRIGDANHVVPLDEIVHIEADDYCVNLHTLAGKKLVLRTSMKKLESRLPGNFVRVHRKYIVNVLHVDRVIKSELVLKNKTRTPISRSRLSSLQEILKGPVMRASA